MSKEQLRDGEAWSSRQPHKLEVAGSNPAPATTMKKVLILGAKPNGRGFGPHLISACKSRGIDGEFTSRWMVDLSKDGWFEKVDFSGVDTIILNAYDYTNHRAQVNAFKKLYAEFRDNPSVQLVVIGSTYHYLEFTPDDSARQYKAAKKELYEFFMNAALNESYACKMFLFEPGGAR